MKTCNCSHCPAFRRECEGCTEPCRYSECDGDGRLTLVSMIDYLQDCSTFHSEELGLGFRELKQKGYGWILAAWRIEIDRLPADADELHREYRVRLGTLGHRAGPAVDEVGSCGGRDFEAGVLDHQTAPTVHPGQSLQQHPQREITPQRERDPVPQPHAGHPTVTATATRPPGTVAGGWTHSPCLRRRPELLQSRPAL